MSFSSGDILSRSDAPDFDIHDVLDTCFDGELGFPVWPVPYDQECPPYGEQAVAAAGQQAIEVAQQAAHDEYLRLSGSLLLSKMMHP